MTTETMSQECKNLRSPPRANVGFTRCWPYCVRKSAKADLRWGPIRRAFSIALGLWIPALADARPGRQQVLKTCLEFREQRIVAGKHVVEIGDRNRFRAVLAQEIRERVNLIGRAVQRKQARDRRPAEWRFNAELSELVDAGKLKVVAARYDLNSGEVELLP